MSETLSWWVMMQVVGLAALPLCLALFRRLPDRGYTLAKAFGLLAVGYLFWLLAHGLPNTTGTIWLVVLLLFAASGYVAWRSRDELLAFARDRWWLIATVEALFFLTFVTAAFLRSYVPDITGTEKPMDFMFLNAVTRAERFPPEDPWLSGEHVAYYYFGYLIVSIVTRLSAVSTAVGFNLGLAMIVALAVVGAFGLVYNLTAPRERAEAGPGTPAAGFSSRPLWRPMLFGLAAGLLLAVMGNLEGLLEFLAAHGFGSDGFWSWVNITDCGRPNCGRTLAPYDSSHWYPDQDLFWWLATRIIQVAQDTFGIHEFPFFSFLLGDLHPHVMAIPFLLLAVGAALALFRSEEPLDLVVWLERPLWLLAFGVILGGLAFLNTWDMPTLGFVLALCALLRNRLLAGAWSWGLALDTLGFLAPLFFVAFLAYTPFFFGGFDSQANGFTAEAGRGTRLFATFLIWGPFAVLVLPYALGRLLRSGRPVTWRAALWSLAPAAAVLALWLVWDVLANAAAWLPAKVGLNEAHSAMGNDAALWSRIKARDTTWLSFLVLSGALGLLVLALAHEVEAVVTPKRRRRSKKAEEERQRDQEEHQAHIFALLLAAVATLLILSAEFFFIQDFFNTRMNTIFKLYYQAWLLLSVAGGVALSELARGVRLPEQVRAARARFTASLGDWSWGELFVVSITVAGAIAGIVWMDNLPTRLVGMAGGAGLFFVASAAAVLVWRSVGAPMLQSAPTSSMGALTWRGVWAGGAAVILLAAFLYPLTATFERTDNFDLPRSLDGLAYLKRNNPDEYQAIQWLAERDGQPVIAQAAGRGYDDSTSRASGATGVPTVLGWQGHEEQWRGGNETTLPRAEDLRRLYTSRDPTELQEILRKYDIRFVYLGFAERQEFPASPLPQMADLFEPVFEEGGVVIYRVRANGQSVARE